MAQRVIDLRSMDAVRDEMAALETGSPVEAIGQYATYRVRCGETVREGKTLKGAYEAMEQYARKNQKRGGCVVPPDKAMSLIDEYYGWPKLAGDQLTQWCMEMMGAGQAGDQHAAGAKQANADAQARPRRISISLDDL